MALGWFWLATAVISEVLQTLEANSFRQVLTVAYEARYDHAALEGAGCHLHEVPTKLKLSKQLARRRVGSTGRGEVVLAARCENVRKTSQAPVQRPWNATSIKTTGDPTGCTSLSLSLSSTISLIIKQQTNQHANNTHYPPSKSHLTSIPSYPTWLSQSSSRAEPTTLLAPWLTA